MNFPSSPQMLYGLRITVEPDTYRTLPAEVCPGVPWPPGFKAEIDAWMKGFFLPRNLIKDGDVRKMPNALHMNPRTFDNLKRATHQPTKEAEEP